MVLTACTAAAQVPQLAPSHAVTPKPAANAATAAPQATPPKPVVRVNGAVLTDNDLVRVMYSMFPYGSLHNGIPKSMEPEIRKGAFEMMVFEELLYQEAKRRQLSIAPARLARAEVAFRKQFPEKAIYNEYLRLDCNGSPQVLKEKIRRSLLIEAMLKTEVETKAQVTLVAAREYYDKNPKQFEQSETIAFQTISIVPPADATPAVKAEAQAKIKDIVRLSRAAKTARDFGLIAEQLSEDDWRTKLGDRGVVEVKNLPPEIVKAAHAMKSGEVSEPIQLGTAWTVIRLNAKTPAGKTPFLKAKAKLQSDLRKQKREAIRAALNQTLRKDAKIEVL